MVSINASDYKNLYLETASEYVDNLSQCCSDLEKNPFDKDALNQLHIGSHSLRSQSQAMNYTSMSAITWTIEKIAKAALEGKNKINNDLTAVLKESVEALNLCLSQIEKENKEKNLTSFIKKLEDAATSSA